MAKQVDPFIKISKKLDALQSKAIKLNSEIAEISTLVSTAQKSAAAASAVQPVAKVAESKGRGRPTAAPKSEKPVKALKAGETDAKKKGRPAKK